jgi:hypothetical protein
VKIVLLAQMAGAVAEQHIVLVVVVQELLVKDLLAAQDYFRQEPQQVAAVQDK